MKILGIDLAGSEKQKTGICILDKKLEAHCFCLFKDKEILELIEKEKPDLIAIDAPLSLPKGRKTLKRKSKIHFRKADKALWKLKIKFFPITLGPMRKLTERGIRLRQILEKRYKVIEVYPGATQDILKIPRKQKGLKKLQRGLERLGIEILKKNPNGDELDAITCAFTGWLFLKGKYLAIGDKKEGQIIIPSPIFYDRKKEVKFLGCKILISKGVFEPRSETKFWVKKAIKDCKLEIEKLKLKKPKFLDIFAGTGFIGVAILKNIKNSFVDFVDIDERAIEQIKANLKLNKISRKRYQIIKSNIFENLKNKKYNFIFANPPYVAKERIFLVQESVKKSEPEICWYGGKEGLKYIKRFLKGAKEHLKKNGKIFLEIDPFQREKVEKILKRENYRKFEFFKDQFGKIRLVKISK